MSRCASIHPEELDTAGKGLQLLPILKALSDPNRLRIVEMLREREQCICHLLERLELTQGTVSYHMAVLKRAGLVRDRRDDSDARWVYYSLTPEAARWGQQLAGLLDTGQIAPAPADCAGRVKATRARKPNRST